jgi:uncharacterized protein (TIGR02597 family)
MVKQGTMGRSVAWIDWALRPLTCFRAPKACILPLLLLGVVVPGVRLGAQSFETISFTGLNLSIPDGNLNGTRDVQPISSTIRRLSSVRVKLWVDGQFNGDLYGYVRHSQAGVTNFCVLLNRPGRTAANEFGYADAGLNITFDDTAANGDIHVYRAVVTPPAGSPLTNTWQPDGRWVDPTLVLDTTARTTSLTNFVGADGSGEWTLFLADCDGNGTNMLVQWALELSGQVQPAIAWPSPAPISYGTALSGTQLNATATFNSTNVPGTFDYSPAAGTVLDAGLGQALSVVFTPTDANTFLSATGSVSLDVIARPRLLSIDEVDSEMVVVWTVLPGLTYQFQYKDDLLSATWTNLGSAVTAGTATVSFTNNPGSDLHRVYRLLAGAAVASDPAGFQKLTFLGNSDTIASMPFTRPAAASGTVSSASGNLVTALGAPGWATNQFVYAAGTQSNTYCLWFDSGTNEGRFFQITTNTTNTLTLDLSGDSLDGVATNDLFSIVPYWTLATIFPNGSGIFASPAPGDRFTEVLMPNFSGNGYNLSPSKTYYVWGGSWKQVGQGGAVKNDDIFPPCTYLIVRHNVPTNSTLTSRGAVVVSKLAIALRVLSTNRQDNFVALSRPTPYSLDDSELVSSGAFRSSPLPGDRTDELLVFDNAATNKNKSPASTYYYWSDAWRRVGSGGTVMDTNQAFLPGTGVIIRKGTNNTQAVWTNSANY